VKIDGFSSKKDKKAEDKPNVAAKAEPKTPSVMEPSTNPSDKEVSQKRNATNKTIRVDSERLDVLLNLFSELVIDRGRLEQLAKVSQNHSLVETVEHLSRISTDLQNVILNLRMFPIEQVFNRFPRMIRDLAKDLNKKVNLVMEGAETELDRSVIDEIGDPLVHLLRNSMDRG
jgi:two-component system, chemotaxis family, sensor kinase CheA